MLMKLGYINVPQDAYLERCQSYSNIILLRAGVSTGSTGSMDPVDFWERHFGSCRFFYNLIESWLRKKVLLIGPCRFKTVAPALHMYASIMKKSSPGWIDPRLVPGASRVFVTIHINQIFCSKVQVPCMITKTGQNAA